MLVLALADPEQNLRIMFPKINFQRNERKALRRRPDLAPADLRTMKQQFSRTFRLMIQAIGFKILLNIAVDEPNFVIFYLRIRLGKRTASLTQALYLASDQNDAALIRIKNLVVMTRLAVLADDPDIWVDILIFLLIF